MKAAATTSCSARDGRNSEAALQHALLAQRRPCAVSFLLREEQRTHFRGPRPRRGLTRCASRRPHPARRGSPCRSRCSGRDCRRASSAPRSRSDRDCGRAAPWRRSAERSRSTIATMMPAAMTSAPMLSITSRSHSTADWTLLSVREKREALPCSSLARRLPGSAQSGRRPALPGRCPGFGRPTCFIAASLPLIPPDSRASPGNVSADRLQKRPSEPRERGLEPRFARGDGRIDLARRGAPDLGFGGHEDIFAVLQSDEFPASAAIPGQAPRNALMSRRTRGEALSPISRLFVCAPIATATTTSRTPMMMLPAAS